MPTVSHPIDPNVKVPASVLAASSRADEIHAAAYPAPEGDATDPAAAPAAADAQPAPVEPAPAPTPAPAPAPAETINWEHRYNSMKGRHDAVLNQLREANARVTELENQLISRPAQPVTPAGNPGDRLVTAEEETEFGQEFLNVVGRKAKEEFLPVVAPLMDKIEKLQNIVVNERKQTAHEKMMEHLMASVPNLETLNNDPKFISWLRLQDPYSGAIRQDMLNDAFERCNGPRVAAFFKGFLDEEAATSPATPPGMQIEGAGTAPKLSLEEIAAPGRAKTAAAPQAPAEKPVFSSAQITRFYTDVSLGKYQGRESEKDSLERQIHEAYREGRIR